MKVSDFVIKFLSSKGVKDVFTLSGGGIIHLIDSLKKNNLNYICCLHEQGAAIAAEAYAQYTNNLGVAIVTTGPGGTNAITGVASAWLDSVPLMIISGQVQKKDMKLNSGLRQKGFQELNLPEIVKNITKYSITAMDPEKINLILNKAFREATSGRKGPVWIEIPLDVQNSEINLTNFHYDFTNLTNQNSIIDINNEFIIDFNKSERPVLLLGNGARNSLYLNLINFLQIPVLTTWKAADLIEEKNSFYIGRPGIIGQRAANYIQQQSDFILCLGTRLDCGQTAFNIENFAPNAIKTIVDIDENELNKNINFKYFYLGDVNDFIQKLLYKKDFFIINSAINKYSLEKQKWLLYARKLKKELHLEQESKNIPLYDFIFSLSKYMNKKDILIPSSSGAASEVVLQSFKIKNGQRLINSPGLGSMGFTIPQGIGACIASGKRNTICIDGDGSFPMNMQELEIIKRLNLPIKIFVLNNHGYASIRNTQDKFFNSNYVASSCESGVSLPDIEKIAKVFNIEYIKYEIESDFEHILNNKNPIICEVILPDKNEIICRTQTYKKEDGTFSTKAMDDLYPSINFKDILK